MVKFVSYDGAYPNYCSGNLVLNIDGKDISLIDCLVSGGYVSGGAGDYEDEVRTGPWIVQLPEDLKPLQEEITKIVNYNLPWGCCGGCL